MSQAIDNNEYSIGLFLDLSKSLDSVDHNILLQKKFETYSIRSLPLRWFENYLNNRQEQVQCNSKASTLGPIKYGIQFWGRCYSCYL